MVGVTCTETVKNIPTAEDQQQINKFARLHKSYLENKVYKYLYIYFFFKLLIKFRQKILKLYSFS
jgi:hypothetical protein